MSLITWACLRCVQELTTILGPQNRTQGSCVLCFVNFGIERFSLLNRRISNILLCSSPRFLQLEQSGGGPDEELRLAEGDVLDELPVLEQHAGALLGVAAVEVWPREL